LTNWVVPRRNSSSLLVDEGFLFLIRYYDDGNIEKEARMKHTIRINYIFWKEGPLLLCLLAYK